MNKNVSPAPNSVLVRGSKGFVHIIPLLIVALLLIFGVGYYAFKNGQVKLTPTQKEAVATPSPIPTENWKTYSDSQYGFSIKYPGNISSEKSENDIYLNFVSFGNPSDEKNVWFSVSVRNTKLEDEVKFVKWQSSHSLVTLGKDENMTVNGYPTVRLEYEPQRPDVGKPTTFIIVNNGKYSYTVNSRTESIDQILSTFKLLE